MSLVDTVLKRRLTVLVNYLGVILTFLIYVVAAKSGWSILLKIGFWTAFATVIITFFPLHIGTGLLRMTHKWVNKLDEREIRQNFEALQRGYYLVVAFAAHILLFIVMDIFTKQLVLLLFYIFLYLAFTIRASILACSVTIVPNWVDED